jgi:hypothetical protein
VKIQATVMKCTFKNTAFVHENALIAR